MSLDINPAVKLIEKTSKFTSKRATTGVLVDKEYKLANGAMLPFIKSNQIFDSGKIVAESSVKKFADGSKFEVYRMKDSVLKILKNKFGEILGYKSSEKSSVLSKEEIIENTKMAFASKVRRFLG